MLVPLALDPEPVAQLSAPYPTTMSPNNGSGSVPAVCFQRCSAAWEALYSPSSGLYAKPTGLTPSASTGSPNATEATAVRLALR